MKTATRISALAWTILGAGAAGAAAGFALPWVRPLPRGPGAELAALRQEAGDAADCDDLALATLHRKSAAQPRLAWTGAQLASLTAALGPSWRCDWEAGPDGGRALTLTRRAPSLDAWPDLLATVRAWSARRGVLLEGVDLVAAGTGSARAFTRVTLRLRFAVPAPALVFSPSDNLNPKSHDHAYAPDS